MGNNFGKLFKITTWGESHGGNIGVIVDGCPPLLEIHEEEIQLELDRRRPGQSAITTQRKEKDRVVITSGIFEGKTLGTPIAMMVSNTDARPEAYSEMKEKYRPSHADFTYDSKYGFRNHEGGGRSSARETIGRVAAGAIAKKILTQKGVSISTYVTQIHDIEMPPVNDLPSMEAVEANPVRCPNPEIASEMENRILEVRSDGDSVGGAITCRIQNVPVGLGEPVFDRLEADLAKAMLSLPAVKGFEIGSGFSGTKMKGSEHNDLYVKKGDKIGTLTNFSGGVQGGISNGEEIYFKVAFKPTATILQPQQTVSKDGEETVIIGRGRHDPCVVPRAVPIVEAMASLVLVDHWMRFEAQKNTF